MDLNWKDVHWTLYHFLEIQIFASKKSGKKENKTAKIFQWSDLGSILEKILETKTAKNLSAVWPGLYFVASILLAKTNQQ